jgi:hypothetical protein
VDAIILAPHVTNVNRRSGIPLGSSDTRRAMYGIRQIEDYLLHVKSHHEHRLTRVKSIRLLCTPLHLTNTVDLDHWFWFYSISGRCPPAAYVDEHANSCLFFEDRLGWNVYQFCLKRKKIVSGLNESKGPKSAQKDSNILGTLNQQEWTFVFERVGALTAKGKAGVNNLADAFTVYTLKHKVEHADVVYTLDLRCLLTSVLSLCLIEFSTNLTALTFPDCMNCITVQLQ